MRTKNNLVSCISLKLLKYLNRGWQVLDNLTGNDWLAFNFACSIAILAIAIFFSVHHFQRRNFVSGFILIIVGLGCMTIMSFFGSAMLNPSDLHKVTHKYYDSYSLDDNGDVYTIGKQRYSKDGSHDSQIAHIDTVTHYEMLLILNIGLRFLILS